MTVDIAKFRGGSSTVVGLLACQMNSYQTELSTKVVSCVPYVPVPPAGAAASGGSGDKKKKKQQPQGGAGGKGEGEASSKLYEIELEDTVLFPEGGGQPSDNGVLVLGGSNSESKPIPVESVRRAGLTALHLIPQPLDPGTPVNVQLNWPRRLDLMQQHTGQHLLSAILDGHNVETLGWGLGAVASYVELPRRLEEDEVEAVQREVTDAILKGLPITVDIPSLNSEGASEKVEVVEHKAPSDYDTSRGVIRVVSIEGLDRNPCCGTHLPSTSAIGALCLLHQVAHKGTHSRLFFTAGARVTSLARSGHAQLRVVNAALSCQTEEITDKLARLTGALRDAGSGEKFWMGEAARHEAAALKRALDSSTTPQEDGKKNAPIAFLHSPRATPDYFRLLERELLALSPTLDGTVVLASGAGKDGGAIVVFGSNVAEVSKRVASKVSNVKGGGKGRWQGKVPVWEKGSLEGLIAEFA